MKGNILLKHLRVKSREMREESNVLMVEAVGVKGYSERKVMLEKAKQLAYEASGIDYCISLMESD